MSSTFGGYSIAVSGMRVNQAALTVTSQNLSNVNTTGYSRQVIASEETVTSQVSTTSTGTGAAVAEVKRARNQLLDTTYRQQNAASEYWATKSGTFDYLQEIVDEFSADDGSADDGLQQTIQNFFDSWENLASDPSSLSTRQLVVEYATSLLDTLSQIDEQLQSLQADASTAAGDIVGEINDVAGQVAELNTQIIQAEAGGAEASDLRDERDALLDELSAYINFSAQEQSNGSVSVFIGGVALVNGDKTSQVNISGDGSVSNPLQVQWTSTQGTVKVTSGSLKACLEDADQTGFETISDSDNYNFTADSVSSISTLRQGLNDLITTIALKVNSLHSAGTGLDDSTGLDFFVVVDSSQPLSISNIQVNPELAEDVNKLAAASGEDAGDNTVANAISSLLDEDLFGYNGLSQDVTSFYQSVISWLATAGSDATSFYDVQATLVTQADNQRLSISSTSLDEEMSNMIMYQNAYSAAARVLSTIDGLIGGLIEELG
ncbi:flagellar hook-associated protein FlgK [Sporomusa sp.]|uniref:flagellar hook-associated protein FlgK n=1 Tax=Sporomusa sp. TaxID=2078658 RepID=UPI002C98C094|nr:flagellar hook-associated protein FlgK [Sporomusa sp.]HWR44985.1 flagellar hook-associated protein FlgK [Sporomusa sp.]